jgi:glycosyltransferase involved in cell wall biosynthesis
MKILHIIPDVNAGGASKGAYRIHHALRKAGVDSWILVLKKNLDEDNIENVNAGIFGWIGRKFFKEINRASSKQFADFRTSNPATHSYGLTRRGILNRINQSDADIVHLHWIVGMLSNDDIGKITKPIVWTIHDMWPFCGAEHYVMDDSPTARFRVGYLPSNQPTYENGPDFTRLSWENKLQAWKDKTFFIAANSTWMQDCAQSSPLFREQHIETIHYPLDLEGTFKPYEKSDVRKLFNLSQDKYIILAGAIDGVNEYSYKGGDLLRAALELIAKIKRTDIVVALFGEKSVATFNDWPFPVINVGRIYDEAKLGKLYASADVLVMPSRQEAFGQVASEAQACGTPVVAFNKGGPVDIIEHQKTGYLAKHLDVADLAEGILWVLNEQSKGNNLSENSRKRALALFSPSLAGQKYVELYRSALRTTQDKP